jgi:hypothetical protein
MQENGDDELSDDSDMPDLEEPEGPVAPQGDPDLVDEPDE